MNTWRVTNAPAVKFLWLPRRQTKKWAIHNEECRGLDEMSRKCLRYLSPCSSAGNCVERIGSCGLVEGGMLLRMDSEATKASTLQCVLSTSGFWAHSYRSRHLLPAASTLHSQPPSWTLTLCNCQPNVNSFLSCLGHDALWEWKGKHHIQEWYREFQTEIQASTFLSVVVFPPLNWP